MLWMWERGHHLTFIACWRSQKRRNVVCRSASRRGGCQLRALCSLLMCNWTADKCRQIVRTPRGVCRWACCSASLGSRLNVPIRGHSGSPAAASFSVNIVLVHGSRRALPRPTAQYRVHLDHQLAHQLTDCLPRGDVIETLPLGLVEDSVDVDDETDDEEYSLIAFCVTERLPRAFRPTVWFCAIS
jgi:hypothetical protein